MGGCLSICEREKNFYEEDEQYQTGNITPGRTKKNKTRIPEAVISSDDEDEDIPIAKHISNTIDQDPRKSIILMNNMEKENEEVIEKIKKAKKNWEYLINKLIQKRIDILREVVKKEKNERESSDSEEDEKLEDIMKEKNFNKSEDKNNRIENDNNISDEEKNENNENINKNFEEKEIKQV